MEAAISLDLSPVEFQWLNFLAMTAAMLIAVGAAVFWATIHRRKRKRKRRHHGHDRINPTRAQVGGLPPPRSKAERESDGGEKPFDS